MEYDVPLTPAQERLWTATRIRPDDPFFHIPFVIDLTGPVDADRLLGCLRALVARHPALRARVRERDGVLSLVSPAEAEFGWYRGVVLDLPEAEAAREIDAVGREPFDLAAGLPLRAQLIRIGQSRFRLAVTVHHLVFDGWSLDVFTSELAVLYGGGGAPDPAALPPLPTPAARSEGSADETAFWVARLAGAPAVLPLPNGRARPVATDHAAARYTRLITGTEPLRALAKARRVTLFILLKAVNDVVLAHYGADDVVTGVALAGRDGSDTHGLIGYLARPIVLRSDLRADPPFRRLLGDVRGDLLDAHEHAELPVEAILGALGQPRDPSHHPLYQVMFAYAAERAPLTAGEVRMTVTEFAPATMKVDLSVVWTDTADGLRLDVDYRADLFDEADLARFADRTEAVLARVPADPAATVSALRRPGAAEFRAAVTDPNRTTAVTDPAVSTDSDRNPDAIAVAPATTYRDLDAAVGATIAALDAAGVRPGDRVGIAAGPSLELVVSVLAVRRFGAVGVLLDPEWPVHALRNSRTETGFRVVLADGRTRPRFDPGEVTVLTPGEGTGDAVTQGEGSEGAAGAEMHDASAAFIAYDPADREQQATVLSGETVRAAVSTLPGDRARVALLTSSADFTTALSILAATTSGGSVLIGINPINPVWATEETQRGEVKPATVTAETGVPAGGPTLLLISADRLRETPEPAATTVVSFGGPLPAGTAGKIHGLHEVIGPLTTGGVALVDGRPRPGIRAYLLADDGTPVPPGAPGELHLGGDLIADGFLDPEGNAETFRPDPLTGGQGRRVRTGIRARLTPDNRFAPDRIPAEDALTAHPDVTGARLTASGTALVTLRPGATTDGLAALLPVHQRPPRILAVPTLTLDDAAIEEALRDSAETPPDADTTPVAAIWEHLLGHPVGVDTSFFDAGGNSLLLIRLRDELTATLGSALTLTDLFSHPTIRTMTSAMRTDDTPAPETPATGRSRGEARRRSYVRRGR